MPANPFVIAYPQAHTDYAVRAVIELTKEVVAKHNREMASATRTVSRTPAAHPRAQAGRKKPRRVSR